jgi:hypothetical protein
MLEYPESGSRNGGRVILQTGLRSTRHRHQARLRCELQNIRSDSKITVTWTDANAIPNVGTLARIADAKHIVLSIATTWTLGKRKGITALQEWFSPVTCWRFIANSVLVARNRIVMDASLFFGEDPERDTSQVTTSFAQQALLLWEAATNRLKCYSTAFPGNKDAPETVSMGKLASSKTNGPPVERL